MAALLNRLYLWQKFMALAILALTLMAIPLTMYISESRKAIDFAEREVRGLPNIRALMNTVLLVQQHRGLSAMMLAGNEAAQAQRAAKQDEVEKAIAAMEGMAANFDNPVIATQWKEARGAWPNLASQVSQRALSGGDSFKQHTALVQQLMRVGERIVDHFGLNLDPEADSYFLVDAALMQSPELMETLGRLRAKGSAILTAKTASVEDRGTLIALADKASERYAAIRNSLEKAYAANPAVKERMAAPLQASLDKGEAVLRIVQDQIVKPEQFTVAAPDYFSQVTGAIGEQVKLYETAAGTLEDILVARKSQLTRTAYLLIGVVLGIAVLGAILGYQIIRSVIGPLHEAIAVAKRVASGDLTARIEVNSRNETGELLQALKDMNTGLVNIVTEVRTGTETIATASGQIAAGNLDLSSRTEQQAGSLEETASSMEEITSTVKQNVDNARQANQLAHSASEVASKGGTMVANVVDTMGSINASSKRIVEIISVIDGIAFQTNILALNAAVEAARAGEQGRGFAVVAAEVRNLAQRSAAAAKEIKELINDSVDKVDAGTRLVDQTGATMQDIVASIKRVSDIISEITAASDEQSAGIEQVNEAITQMDEVTQQNASLVEEAAAAAESLQEQAQNLAGVVSVFRIGDQAAQIAQTPPATAPQASRKASITRLAAARQLRVAFPAPGKRAGAAGA
jgi:methyl-accepting chemotaxis protein